MDKKDQWEEATSGNVIKLEPGERIEGIFKQIEPSLTYKDSFALHIEVKEENTVLFVNKIVNDLLSTNSIKHGQEISLLFVGMKKTIDGKFEYKDYKLFFKK